MKTTLAFALVVGLFLNAPVFAGIVQVIPISVSTSGNGFVAGGVASNFVATGLQPFDSALGTLYSFEFSWVMTLSASATTDEFASDSNYEFISGNAGGAYFIGSSLYAGNGGGGGSGSNAPNQLLSFSFQADQDTLFQVADAGAGYDQFILNKVTGPNPFNADWSATVRLFNYSGLPWTAGVNGSLTTTYNYTPNNIPEPSTFALMLSIVLLAGIVRFRRRIA